MALSCLIGFLGHLLLYGIALAFAALGLFCLALRSSEALRKKWFVFIFAIMEPKMAPKLMPFKDQIFKDLDKVVSKDPDLRKDNLFRLLEIGVGLGSNLCYYPKNCRFISVEPNDGFKKEYEANSAKYPNLVMEKFVTGQGEDMSAIPDESVDVVVSTHVLCSVTDVQSVFKEVKRVLCKDGLFLLFEHIAEPGNTMKRKLQDLANPLWKVVFDGCVPNRQTDCELKNAGFAKVEVQVADISGMAYLVQRHLYGKAIK